MTSNTGCCGDAWDCSGSNGSATPTTPPRFELKSPLGPCVPTETMKSLPEFLKWFSSFGTPMICKLSDLKGSSCSVLTGEGGELVVKSLQSMVDTCVGGGADCSEFLKKLDGATTCIPRTLGEKAAVVMSIDTVTGKIAWRTLATDDCAAFLARLDGGTACVPRKLTETATVVMSVDPATGSVAWRLPPAIDCEVLENLLKPGPGGCFPESTSVPAKVFSLTDTGAIEWIAPTSGGSALSCTAVKTALEGGCIPDGILETDMGFDASGLLMKQPRRRLIRMAYRSADLPNEVFTDTLANHALSANRRNYKWQDFDSTFAALAPGQYKNDLVYDPTTGRFTIGHAAVYRFSASVFARLKTASVVSNTVVSVLAGWYVARAGVPAIEFRFGQESQDLGDSDTVRGPSSDWFFSGTIQLYMPAGSVIGTRVWASPGNAPSPSQTVDLMLDFRTPSSTLSIEELDDYA